MFAPFVLDDGMYELLRAVPGWLARWSLTQRWIGHAREVLALHPWLDFYIQDGHAYAVEQGDGLHCLAPQPEVWHHCRVRSSYGWLRRADAGTLLPWRDWKGCLNRT